MRMNNSKFLLSIIVPTKNRQRYASKVVEQILEINDNRIQVVIQDNSDTKELSSLLLKYKEDRRLKYNYSVGVISFVDNFSLAVTLSDGEYVCIIGDDDGILPQIIDVVEWASANSIDAIKPEQNAVYFWPNSGAIGNRIDDGYMNISKITGKAKVFNPLDETIKLLNRGAQKYLTLNMVKLYHGIVKKDCLDRIKKQTGKYFGGLSPDMYIAVALSITIDKVVQIDFPLTISGICSMSGSSDSATGKHTGELKDAPHFRGHDKYEWSELVPNFYSVETIWADSALAAIKDLNKSELDKEFDIAALAAYCLIKHPQFKDIIRSHYSNCSKTVGNSKGGIAIAYLKNPTLDYINKILHRLRRRRGDVARFNGIENIIQAGDVLQQRLIEVGIDSKMLISSLNNLMT